MTIKSQILKISKELGLSHLGSCITAANAIEVIYRIKEKNEKFVLSNGHAAMALYVVLEQSNPDLKAEELAKWGVHPDRATKIVRDGMVIEPIDCSTGSLGHGLGIAVGMALSNRHKNVYCMISDGESAEGSILESLRIAAEQKLTNLKLVVNANGYSAYGEVDLNKLMTIFRSLGWGIWPTEDDPEDITKGLMSRIDDIPIMVFNKTNCEGYPFLKGLDAHYCHTYE